jgi:uncharacterized protein YjbI with pentapeptide repeats
MPWNPIKHLMQPTSHGRRIADTVALGIVLVMGPLCAFCYWEGSKQVLDWLTEAKPWVLVSGLAAAPSLILTWIWREAHKRADIEKGREDIRLASERMLTERFTQAIGQLGSDKMEVRLGAIYALERISRDSEKDHWTVVETLAAFIRENAPWREGNATHSEADDSAPHKSTTKIKPRTDVQAALTVLGRREHREEEKENQIIDLAETDLRGADLYLTHFESVILHGAHLEKASLGGANLEYAYLRETHLEKADLFGAHLENAKLIGANLAKANLTSADLRKAWLEGVVLFGCNFTGATIDGESKFDHAYFNSKNWQDVDPTIFPSNFDPAANGMIDVSVEAPEENAS